jgi:predicted aspartyl protease
MPHFTLVVGSDGPVIDLAVAVSWSWQRRLLARDVVVPSPMTVRALVDTGSDRSAVHPQVLQQLGVPEADSIRVRRPGLGSGFRIRSLSDVRLSIGGLRRRTLWVSTQVIGLEPSTPTVLALIGRDVLELCTLFYNGPRGELTLSC